LDSSPYSAKKRRIPNNTVIEQIKLRGIKEVYIDTARGLDEEDAFTQPKIEQQNQTKLDKAWAQSMAHLGSVTVEEELFKARKLQEKAKSIMTGVLSDVKFGKPLVTEDFDELADGMIDSVMRNHNALACLGRIRHFSYYLCKN
jgi:hypothetical protein